MPTEDDVEKAALRLQIKTLADKLHALEHVLVVLADRAGGHIVVTLGELQAKADAGIVLAVEVDPLRGRMDIRTKTQSGKGVRR